MGDGSTVSNQITTNYTVPPNGYCTIFPDNPHYCDIVIGVRKTAASISLIGCLFMIAVIWLFRKYVVFSQRLILYLSIAAFLDCTAYLMGDLHPDGPLCDFQGFWLTYFDWCVLLWVSCLTFNLYMNVVKAKYTERYEWAYHLVCWLFPLFMSCLPFIGDHYGPAGPWCWIIDNWHWRVGIWYGPLFLIIAAMVVAYSYLAYKIKKRSTRWEGTYDPDVERNKQLMMEGVTILRFYPFVYLIVSIFPLINRIQNAADPNSHVFALVLLSAISSPLHGAANTLVFGLDKDTYSRLTPSQLKVALMSHLYPEKVQDYPTAGYHSTDESLPHQDVPKFSHVSYSRLG